MYIFTEKLCSRNRYQCSDRKCIASSLRCDGMLNCEDGSDESMAYRVCGKYANTCEYASTSSLPCSGSFWVSVLYVVSPLQSLHRMFWKWQLTAEIYHDPSWPVFQLIPEWEQELAFQWALSWFWAWRSQSCSRKDQSKWRHLNRQPTDRRVPASCSNTAWHSNRFPWSVLTDKSHGFLQSSQEFGTRISVHINLPQGSFTSDDADPSPDSNTTQETFETSVPSHAEPPFYEDPPPSYDSLFPEAGLSLVHLPHSSI